MKLVIVESPAKCGKIQGYLGEDYQVIATMGHIRALEENIEAVGIDRDFDARYEFLSTKSRAIKQIKEAAASADLILLASDDDREGEAISYAVALLLRLSIASTPRVVFHEITKQAIRAAVAAPRTIDMNRVFAQQARSILDLMVGYTISPLLWKHVAPSLSAGRCQTPALRLVIEREKQIADFRGSSSWRVSGEWAPVATTVSVHASALMDDDLEDEESALNYLENIAQPPTNATITNANTKQWSTSSPLPLITSTLQQQASALFHINPKTTMQSAQRLYEQGYITYMRTDKAVLSQEAREQVCAYIEQTFGAQYVNRSTVSAVRVTPAANAQEAHEAIRPTNITLSTLPDNETVAAAATQLDRKIYGLIWQRTLQSQMTAAQGETFVIKFVVEAASDFPWTASWRRTTFLGWQRIGKVADIDAEDDDTAATAADNSDNFSMLQQTYVPGTILKWGSLEAAPHELRQPPRYTEATLVRDLEKHGIGRPSTFATLIAAIQDKGYAEITNFEGKKVPVRKYTLSHTGQWPPTIIQATRNQGAERQKLAPTDLGRTVLQFLLTNFSDLFAYDFTGLVEARLDRIAAGQEPFKQVLRDVWESYKERYDTLKNSGATTATTTINQRQKVFAGGLKAVITKKGPLLLTETTNPTATRFHGWPNGISFQDITQEQAITYVQSQANTTVGMWRGHSIERRTGKFGPYVVAGPHTVSIAESDTVEIICSKLDARADNPSSVTPIAKFKEFEIRNGPYGQYILKPKLKTQKFVSLPKTITEPEKLSEKEVEALYKAGIEQKSRFKKKSG
jgi:DNA topoisomerase-1